MARQQHGDFYFENRLPSPFGGKYNKQIKSGGSAARQSRERTFRKINSYYFLFFSLLFARCNREERRKGRYCEELIFIGFIILTAWNDLPLKFLLRFLKEALKQNCWHPKDLKRLRYLHEIRFIYIIIKFH